MNEALRDWVANVARHLLPDRHRRRPAPLSGDGPRLPERDRHGGARADAGRRGPAAGRAGRRDRRRLQRDRACSTRSSTTPRCDARRRGGRPRPRHRAARRQPHRRPPRACCTATGPTCCRTSDGQITEAHSISAGLDYPGIGPEHAWLHESGRVEYVAATDDEALDAFQLCTAARGHHPRARTARTPSPHVHEARADARPKDAIVLMNLCGRGDKDIFTVATHLGVEM